MEDTLKKAEDLILNIDRIDGIIKLFRETEYDGAGHKNQIEINIYDSSGQFQNSFPVDDEPEKYIREYYINKFQQERDETREKLKKVMEEL